MKSTMDKLKKLISMCKASVEIAVNVHRGNYQTVIQYMKDKLILDKDLFDDLPDYVYKQMIAKNSIIEVVANPANPVGFYKVYHYDIEQAIDQIISDIEIDQTAAEIEGDNSLR